MLVRIHWTKRVRIRVASSQTPVYLQSIAKKALEECCSSMKKTRQGGVGGAKTIAVGVSVSEGGWAAMCRKFDCPCSLLGELEDTEFEITDASIFPNPSLCAAIVDRARLVFRPDPRLTALSRLVCSVNSDSSVFVNTETADGRRTSCHGVFQI
jgi:hypothetical protein